MLESGYERLQHRDDEALPPLPGALQRGTPGSVLSPVAVQPVEVVHSAPPPPAPAEQVAGLQHQLIEQAHVDHPDFYKLDTEAVDDPVLARLRAWRPALED